MSPPLQTLFYLLRFDTFFQPLPYPVPLQSPAKESCRIMTLLLTSEEFLRELLPQYRAEYIE
jgi:hypothetical protein